MIRVTLAGHDLKAWRENCVAAVRVRSESAEFVPRDVGTWEDGLVRLLVTLAFGLAACVRSNLVECEDGRACPVGTVCDLAHQGCVDPDQLGACAELPDFAACTAIENGRCFDGVCLSSGCGNGFLEPEELCDDGNTTSGDLCLVNRPGFPGGSKR